MGGGGGVAGSARAFAVANPGRPLHAESPSPILRLTLCGNSDSEIMTERTTTRTGNKIGTDGRSSSEKATQELCSSGLRARNDRHSGWPPDCQPNANLNGVCSDQGGPDHGERLRCRAAAAGWGACHTGLGVLVLGLEPNHHLLCRT